MKRKKEIKQLQTLYYKKNDEIMTKIMVDYKNETILVQNYTDRNLDKAFGANENPSFADFEAFLEDRCFPRNRDHMKLHLNELKLDFYDPYNIVRKTHGKLEGDSYSIEFEDELEQNKSEDDYEAEF